MKRLAATSVCFLAILTMVASVALAQQRTTPVEVTNTPTVGISPSANSVTLSGTPAVSFDPFNNFVRLDGTHNTVKIDGTVNGVQAVQSGAWSVGISGIPTVGFSTLENTVKFDSTANTVKAGQSGAWNVGITGTPPVQISGTPTVGLSGSANTVKAEQSGAWNVGITGTPGVSISGTPTVSVSGTPAVTLSGTNNTVKTPTQGQQLSLWGVTPVISAGSSVTSDIISCSNYKELRVFLTINAPSSSVRVVPAYYNASSWWNPGYFSFGSLSPGLGSGAGFTPHNQELLFSMPVMSPYFRLEVFNDSASSVGLYAAGCWVYLVN